MEFQSGFFKLTENLHSVRGIFKNLFYNEKVAMQFGTKDGVQDMRKRSVYVYLAILAGAIFLNVAAWNSKSFADWYMMYILPFWVGSYGRLMGLLPFSVGEWMLVAGALLLVLAVLLLMVRVILMVLKRGEKTAAFCRTYHHVTAWIALGVFVTLTLNCFICYHGTDFADRYFPEKTAEEKASPEGEAQADSMVKGTGYTLEELLSVRDFVVEKCNKLAGQMERDQWGNVIYSGDMEAAAVACMQALGEEYPQLTGYYPKPKKIYFSGFLSQQYMQGYFFPFSMEANYNQIMNITNKPATMCHELAHLKGFLQEDEANLIGYLACIRSEDLLFQYSGYLSVLNYLDNDYFDAVNQNREQYLSHVKISAQVLRDNQFLSQEAWETVEKRAIVSTETVEKISDEIVETTLVMNGVEDGMLSYCRVVGLLLDYYAGQPEEIYMAASAAEE